MALPVLTVAQMRRWESASWAAGRSSDAVIAEVGRQVGARALAMTGAGDVVLVLAGRGHNGDDARAALPHLAGRKVKSLDVTDPVAALPALEAALALRPALVVDGLFGIGLNRPLDAGWCRLIGLVSQAARPLLAVDLPSGLNADTGLPMGAALRATLTLTIGAPKLGLCRPEAAQYVGRLEVAGEVGLLDWRSVWVEAPLGAPAWWTEAADFAGFPPPRRVDAHKGDFGHLLLLAGSLGYHGAAILAARAALRAGPGLVTVITSPETYGPVAAQLAAPMVRPWSLPLSPPPKTTALAVGPGLAGPEVPEALRETVRGWWRDSPLPMVADASALDWIRDAPPSQSALRVWTPHPGEAARLLGVGADAVQADRWIAARQLGERAWVVLKGAQTIVTGPGQPLHLNSSGNPGLAQGGAGDVLTGYLGGLAAQPECSPDPGRLIRCAVWRHGAAADDLESAGQPWTSEDLAGRVGAMQSLRGPAA